MPDTAATALALDRESDGIGHGRRARRLRGVQARAPLDEPCAMLGGLVSAPGSMLYSTVQSRANSMGKKQDEESRATKMQAKEEFAPPIRSRIRGSELESL